MEFSIFKALYEMLERLIRSSVDERRTRYNELISPLYDQLQVIHLDYVEMFCHVMSMLPQTASAETADLKVQAAKDEFESRRLQREGVRDSLRYQSGYLLRAAKSEEERRFLLALIYYFLRSGPWLPNERSLDHTIAGLIEDHPEEAGARRLDTPSIRVALEISGMSDPEEIRRKLIEELSEINARFSNASLMFAKIRLALYS
jgi:hypothetical protein